MIIIIHGDSHDHKEKGVWLMCALKAHIKFSVFKNIFSKIKKVVIIFLIFEIYFFKIKINIYPKHTHQ